MFCGADHENAHAVFRACALVRTPHTPRPLATAAHIVALIRVFVAFWESSGRERAGSLGANPRFYAVCLVGIRSKVAWKVLFAGPRAISQKNILGGISKSAKSDFWDFFLQNIFFEKSFFENIFARKKLFLKFIFLKKYFWKTAKNVTDGSEAQKREEKYFWNLFLRARNIFCEK